jgi:hypothetical protein
MARFFFHIRVADVIDPDYEGVEIKADDCVAQAIAIARRMVAELMIHDEPLANLIFEIADAEGRLVAALPFHCCASLQ